MATNPIVKVDLASHPMYSDCGATHAEILTLNFNTETMRCRLLKNGEYVRRNLDIWVGYISDEEIRWRIHDN